MKKKHLIKTESRETMGKKIKEFIMKNLRALLISLSVFSLIIIVHQLLNDQIQIFDEKVYELFRPIISDHATFLFRLVTATGGAIFLVTLTILFILLRKDRTTCIAIPLNLIFVTLLNILIKHLVARPRPTGINLIQETGYSFPSGHAMVNTAFYGFLIYLIYRNEPNKRKRNLLCGFFALLIFGICSSRIYLGVHYASDVLAGIGISLTYLCIFTKVYKEIREKKSKEES